ncbi:MAG: hypothetical protein HGA45_19805 [Chloroflexales bacterium]|nr:hypothetical protein [Chloroflexales bacterium]
MDPLTIRPLTLADRDAAAVLLALTFGPRSWHVAIRRHDTGRKRVDLARWSALVLPWPRCPAWR